MGWQVDLESDLDLFTLVGIVSVPLRERSLHFRQPLIGLPEALDLFAFSEAFHLFQGASSFTLCQLIVPVELWLNGLHSSLSGKTLEGCLVTDV